MSLFSTLQRRRVFPRANSVRGKLIGIVLATTGLALVVAAIAMLTYDLSTFRKSWIADLSAEAQILALSIAPAVAFDDHDVASRNLEAMQARSAIRIAAAYNLDGVLYASYTRSSQDPAPPIVPMSYTGAHVEGGQVEFIQPIVQNGERLGFIYLRAKDDVRARIATYSGIFILAILLGMVVALLASVTLQKGITEPLDAMAKVAHQVIDHRDYSSRVGTFGRDEIGTVVAAFDSMLDEVQAREATLRATNSALSSEVAVRIAAEAALRDADRRKDEFLATLAHELRNPLAPIRHAVKLMEVPAATHTQKEWSRQVISRQVQRMALLLDDLLDVSRITRGRLELRRSPVTLSALVAAAVEAARPLIEAKQHSLSVSLPEEPLELDVDPLRMSQALSNLLTNAAKYMDAGGSITVTASLSVQALTIMVRDTGIGLSTAVMPHLFEMFSQVESAIDRAEGGLGIGLALVKGLMGLHGGSVTARSAGLGQGSEFELSLPVSAVRIKSNMTPTVPTAHAAAPSPRGRLLLADDNHDAADTMAEILSVMGHQVFVGHSSQEALDLGAREHPDAIILDIGMPDMSGYEAATRIRGQSWGVRVLLIAVTGWGGAADKEKARAAGFDHHLTKPVDPEEIETLVTRFLRSRAP